MSESVEKHIETQNSSDLELFQSYLDDGIGLDLDMPSRGDLREGSIVEIRANELLVNIGSKRDGVVPQSDLSRLDPEFVKNLHEGQKVYVVIAKDVVDDGIFVLSIADAQQQRDWIVAQEMMESGEVSEHRVLGHNKGGLTVEFGHLRGFVPSSHLIDMPRNISDEHRQAEFDRRVGQKIKTKVIEVDPKRRRLVMSQMLAEREVRSKQREKLMDRLVVGAVVQGVVRSLRPFGAFVDLGGIDGLLHVSEIGWSQVAHPKDELTVGQKIDVQIIRIDDNQRIALSRKRVLPNPWDNIESRYTVGSIVPATITRVVDFGAFAQLEPGVEGLIHLSEIADITVAEPLKTIRVGDHVMAKVLRVDNKRQRIGLSIRQVSSPGVSSDDEVEDAG
ncbi:MAG: S1 RNA-binding domain-containing protein [Caldilineaceae bacterium]